MSEHLKNQTLTVHKEGAEGTLQIDRLTGKILTPLADKPDWAQGLASAIPQERVTFYMQRFGTEGSEIEAVKNADAVAMQDLSWVGLDAAQEAVELPADHEHRLQVVAKVLDLDSATGNKIERELDMENSRRSPEEQAAMEKATQQGFPAHQAEQAKTGTNDQ